LPPVTLNTVAKKEKRSDTDNGAKSLKINTMQATKITFEEIKNLMDKTYSLNYVDYRQSLDEHGELLEECIEKRSLTSIYENLNEWFDGYDGYVYALEELKKDICRHFDIEEDEADEILDEYEDEIRDEIYERDDSDPVKDILCNTDDVPVMVEMFSNYDCINSHWLESGLYSYEESYFGQVVDVLNLNPQTVKKELVRRGYNCGGKWPNLKKRDGNELVSLAHFMEEDENRSCGACLLVFVGTIDLSKMVDDFKKVVIPKGNTCGFFSSFQGGGSLIEMELLGPLEIDLESCHHETSFDTWGITTANNGNYSIKSVYGVCDDFFGGNLTTKA
jgi:hypothetical protein